MSTIKVQDIQHTASSNDAISLASDSSVALKFSGSTKLVTSSAGVTISDTCTATTFSGSGASLTALPAANITGTLPAIDGSNLTGLSAGALEFISESTVSSGTTTTFDFTNLTADTVYRMEGYFKFATGNSEPYFMTAITGGYGSYGFGSNVGHVRRCIYYGGTDADNGSGSWRPTFGGYSYRLMHFTAEFSTYVDPWFRLEGSSTDNAGHFGLLHGSINSSYSPSTSRITDLRIADTNNYGYESPTRVRLFKYVT